MSQMKPCPFCGAAPKFVTRSCDDLIEGGAGPTGYGDFRCGTDGCLLEEGADWYVEHDEAAAMWNKRA
jgi:hypothetical protein